MLSLNGSPLSSWRSHEEFGHSASFDSQDKDAPSKPGIKHLVASLDVPRQAGAAMRISKVSLSAPAIAWATRFAFDARFIDADRR
jgi:hypothetical protein